MNRKASTCSFCGTSDRPCVVSEITNKAICILCIQIGDEVAGGLPMGAIRCPSCKAHTSFLVTYQGGKVHYAGGALDFNGVFMYTIHKVEGNWDETQLKKSGHCGLCKKEVPLYLFGRSEYIR